MQLLLGQGMAEAEPAGPASARRDDDRCAKFVAAREAWGLLLSAKGLAYHGSGRSWRGLLVGRRVARRLRSTGRVGSVAPRSSCQTTTLPERSPSGHEGGHEGHRAGRGARATGQMGRGQKGGSQILTPPRAILNTR